MGYPMGGFLYLARHGETSWNQARRWQGWTDVALNEAGEGQASALAGRVVGLGVQRIVASNLTRAKQTAEIVARALALGPVGVDADLRERGFGWFEGLTPEECEVRYPAEWQRYRADGSLPPGAEPYDEVTARMGRAVRRAVDQEPAHDGAVLIVTHGSALRAFVRIATGLVLPPLANVALFRVTVEADRFLDVTPVD